MDRISGPASPPVGPSSPTPERRGGAGGNRQPSDDAVAVELRSFQASGETWYATLNLRSSGTVCRGFIAFHREDDPKVHRTADIFRERVAGEVRSKFRSFDEPALRAFLRSVRP